MKRDFSKGASRRELLKEGFEKGGFSFLTKGGFEKGRRGASKGALKGRASRRGLREGGLCEEGVMSVS